MLKRKIIILLVVSNLVLLNTQAQTCVDDFFVASINTQTVKNLSATLLTPQNEILLTGDVLRPNPLLSDGWLSKLTPQGTPLWSRRYTSSSYNTLQFKKSAPTNDEGFLVVGNIGTADSIVGGDIMKIGLMVKVDKYGNIVWTKYLDIVNFSFVEINNIETLSNGDYLIVASQTWAGSTNNVVMCLDPDGNPRWSKTIRSNDFRSFPVYSRFQYHYFDKIAPMSFKQLRNGNIILSRFLSYRPSSGSIRRGYYAICMNPSNGNIIWDNAYVFADPNTSFRKPYGDVQNISEMPNGDIGFISSYGDSNSFSPPFTQRMIRYTTNSAGALKNVTSYRATDNALYATSAASLPDGRQIVLMDNSFFPYLMMLGENSEIQWQKSFTNLPLSQGSYSLLSTQYGLYFFTYTMNGGSKDMTLVKTDVDGNANCTSRPASFNVQDITTSFVEYQPGLEIDPRPYGFKLSPVVGSLNYPVLYNSVCRQSCCAEVTTTNRVDLCNIPSYPLPNGYVADESGMYNIIYRSALGCDSIVYYDLTFSKPPKIDLGFNTCIDGRDSVILKATPGFYEYNWMGTITNSPTYVIRQPGTYWVRVTNACGTTADTIQVFKDCDFDIYIPSAFTPNGDYLNDKFGLPKSNNNKLISLSIYNRWGDLVFYTTEQNGEWDGKMKDIPLSTGVYVYKFVLEGLSGKKITKSGTVTLIR